MRAKSVKLGIIRLKYFCIVDKNQSGIYNISFVYDKAVVSNNTQFIYKRGI